MANFLEAIENAKRLTPKKISSDLFSFIRKFEKHLADENVDVIFNESKDVFGSPIGFYSKGTESITGGRKKAGQPFDLKETGEFLEKVFANVEKESIFFDTSDDKRQDVLSNLLSRDIFGLSDDRLNKFLESKVLPFLIEYYWLFKIKLVHSQSDFEN